MVGAGARLRKGGIGGLKLGVHGLVGEYECSLCVGEAFRSFGEISMGCGDGCCGGDKGPGSK
jgi:hypothetical protein